jgi:hypothetical protein
MRKSILVVLALVSLVAVMSLSSCAKDAANTSIVGTWNYKIASVTLETYVFKSDNTYTLGAGTTVYNSGTYTANSGTLTLSYGGYFTSTYQYSISSDGETLTLTDSYGSTNYSRG